MDDGKARHIRGKFSSEWAEILERRVTLECSDEETVYLTRPNDAMKIQRIISKHVDRVEVVVDAFACIGGDSLAIMCVHPSADLYAIQRVKSDVERDRFSRLGSNIRKVRNILRRPGRVNWVDSDVGNFLMKFDQSISVLYLDPPWAVGSDPSKISPLSEIRRFLENNVFNHLRKDAYPRAICFKLPFKARDIENWPGLTVPYVSVGYKFMRESYHIHVVHIAES